MDILADILIGLLIGLSYGVVLFLIAVGLSLILGVMGIVNLAHGAVFVVGGYIGLNVAKSTGNFLLGLLAGLLGSGIVGLILERGVLSRLYKRFDDQILVTFGFVYILLNLNEWIWGSMGKAPFIPSIMSGSVLIYGETFPIHRLVIIIIGLVVCSSLWWLQDRTRIGAIIRAQMYDAEMTGGLGVNATPVIMGTFFLGSCLAGFAAVMGAPLLGAISTITAMDILWLALAVCIIGGMGSVQGALAGALLIGVVTTFSNMYLAGFSSYAPYLLLVLILLFRPSGLLGKKI